MYYSEAEKLKVGYPVQAREEGKTNRLITKIKPIEKGFLITLDSGKEYHHTKLNTPILFASSPFLCSWYGYVNSIAEAYPNKNVESWSELWTY